MARIQVIIDFDEGDNFGQRLLNALAGYPNQPAILPDDPWIPGPIAADDDPNECGWHFWRGSTLFTCVEKADHPSDIPHRSTKKLTR